MSDRGGHTGGGARWIMTLAGFVVVVAGLKAASAIIIPLLVALFVSILSYPLLSLLRRRRVPLLVAVAVTLLADVAVLAGAGALVSGSVAALVDDRAYYQQRIGEYAEQVEQQRKSAVAWFKERGVTPPVWLEGISIDDRSALDGSDESLGTTGALGVGDTALDSAGSSSWWIDAVDVDSIFGAANRAVRGVASILTNSLIVALITAFILLEAASFPRKLAHAFDNRQVEDRFRRVTSELQRYLLVKTAIGLVTGLLIGVWLAICGLNSPVLWGLVAFVLNYIPNLGSIIAAVPAILFAALQLGLGPALLVAIGFLVVNVVIGNMLEPQIVGAQLGLSPLVVFLSLVFWGWVWGPAGMILSVPITMVLKLALENSRDLGWLSVLLERGSSAKFADPVAVRPPPACE